MGDLLIHDIPFDRPPLQFSAHGNEVELLAILKHEVAYDYRSTKDCRKVYAEVRTKARTYSLERLEAEEVKRDGPLLLELCMRRLSMIHQAAEMHPQDTLQLLRDLAGFTEIMGDANSRPIIRHTQDVKYVASALLLWFYFKSVHFPKDKEADIIHGGGHYLEHMGDAANLCAMYDFIPRVVIRYACWLESFPARFGTNARAFPSFKYQTFFWPKFDEYAQARKLVEQERLDRIAAAPNRYQCAADGCDVQAFHRAALQRCGGKCPEDRKPYYCSRECGVRHWFVHRYSCIPAKSDPILDDDEDEDWEDIATYTLNYEHDSVLADAEVWSARNREIFVDIRNPDMCHHGEVYRIRTKTLSPAFLRSYKALWELPHKERSLRFTDILTSMLL